MIKYDLRRGDVVGGVAQLQDGTHEAVMVKAASRASFGHWKALRGFYRYLCPAIRLREVGG